MNEYGNWFDEKMARSPGFRAVAGALIVVCFFVVMALAGCASTPELTPAPTPKPTVLVTPTPAPAPTPVVTPLPPPPPKSSIKMGKDTEAPYGYTELCEREPHVPECGGKK